MEPGKSTNPEFSEQGQVQSYENKFSREQGQHFLDFLQRQQQAQAATQRGPACHSLAVQDSAMDTYNIKKKRIHEWTSSLNEMGPVYTAAQVSSEKPPSNYATRDLATETVTESQLQAELKAGA